MNFLKNFITQFKKRGVCDATLKENSDDLIINDTIEHCTSGVEQNANSIEEIITSQPYKDSENDNTVRDTFTSKKSNVGLSIENIINISKNETLIDDFVDFINNELVQNNKRDSETELILYKKDDSSITEINDFEEVLKEFWIKGDNKFPKRDNVVDSVDKTGLNIINEEIVLNLDEFYDLFDTSNDQKETEISNDNKNMSVENNALYINQMQLEKPKKYSDNETHSGQKRAEYKQVHETQFKNTNNVENFKVQSDKIRNLTFDAKTSSINTSMVVDITIEEDNRQLDDTKNQNSIQDNKIENTQDESIQNMTNYTDIQDTGKLKEESNNTRITLINNDNIAECKDDNRICKLEKDDISIEFVNERDNKLTVTSDYGPTDIETISLLSMEANLENVDMDFCNGYHSSDFEFITESDAEIDCLISNTSKTVEIKKSKTKRVNASKNASSNKIKPESTKVLNNGKIPNYNINEHIHQPGTSNSKTNTSFTHFNNTVNNVQNYTISSRFNHAIPQGEEYLNLFQDIYAPMFTDNFFLENKSVRTQTCMNMQYEGVGFDIRMPYREDSDDEYKEEANESVKKILELYPIENRSKRKRRRI